MNPYKFTEVDSQLSGSVPQTAIPRLAVAKVLIRLISIPCWMGTLILTVGGTLTVVEGEPVQDWAKLCLLAATLGFLLTHSLSSSRTVGDASICFILGGVAFVGTAFVHTANYLELKSMGSNCGLAACAYLVFCSYWYSTYFTVLGCATIRIIETLHARRNTIACDTNRQTSSISC